MMQMKEPRVRDLQLIELEMLKQVKQICVDNNITYYLSDGTVLGAVRHQGFIPWDDDVDIAIPRPEYNRFVEIAVKELNYPYEVLKPGDEGYIFGFVKIIDKRVKVRTTSRENPKEWYLWVDIFPLDSMPRKGLYFNIRKYHLLFRRMMYLYSCFNDMVSVNRQNRPFYERILIKVAKVLKPERYLDTNKQILKLNNALMKYPFIRGDYLISFHGAYKFKSLMDKSIYGTPQELIFEDDRYSVPQKYDEYLTRLYGDYMKLPPEDQRNQHELEIIEFTT